MAAVEPGCTLGRGRMGPGGEVRPEGGHWLVRLCDPARWSRLGGISPSGCLTGRTGATKRPAVLLPYVHWRRMAACATHAFRPVAVIDRARGHARGHANDRAHGRVHYGIGSLRAGPALPCPARVCPRGERCCAHHEGGSSRVTDQWPVTDGHSVTVAGGHSVNSVTVAYCPYRGRPARGTYSGWLASGPRAHGPNLRPVRPPVRAVRVRSAPAASRPRCRDWAGPAAADGAATRRRGRGGTSPQVPGSCAR